MAKKVTAAAGCDDPCEERSPDADVDRKSFPSIGAENEYGNEC